MRWTNRHRNVRATPIDDVLVLEIPDKDDPNGTIWRHAEDVRPIGGSTKSPPDSRPGT